MQSSSAPPPSERNRVAVVEDEETVRASVVFSLEQEGYGVREYSDGLAAWEAWADASAELPDLVVLDIMMPRMDGLELCRRLRERSESLPILFLTSRDEEFDRVLGLELGADDYLCKPFSMRELMARVKVLMRRLQLLRARGAGPAAMAESPEDVVQVGALRLDTARHEASWNDTELRLTITEFLMVRALAQRPGHVRSRAQLIEEGYPHDAYVSDRTVDTHIKRLRRKFADVDPQFDDLETVYGVGYRWRER